MKGEPRTRRGAPRATHPEPALVVDAPPPDTSPVGGMAFLRTFLAVLALLAAGYASVVVAVNPRREFWSEWFPEQSPNSRARKLAMFDAYDAEAPVRGVLLGSSREMNLRPGLFDQLTGIRFFQLGVLAAVPEDYLALYRYLVRRGVKLDVVIVGIDLASLGESAPVPYDLRHSLVLQSVLSGTTPGPVDRIADAMGRVKRIYTISYALDTRSSVKAAWLEREPRNSFDPDGKMNYPVWERELAAGVFAAGREMDGCLARLADAHRALTRLSTARTQALTSLVTEARARGTRVILWITPFHPRLLALFDGAPTRANNALAYAFVDDMRARLGADVRDLSRIEAYGGDPRDWYECVHFRDQEADRITRALVGRGL